VVPCHTCGGQGFYWRDDPKGELERYPVPCRDCTAFQGLRASRRMLISRTFKDTERRLARRESAKNPRWFDDGAAGGKA